MDNILYATERLIDSVWTLGYEKINDTQIKIISFSRDNPIGYKKEKELPRIRLIEEEGKGRIVIGAYFSKYEPFKYCATKQDEKFEVINPQNIFSY